ncbi:MAG: nucleotide sugar dehydrogenase [Solirubrobacteraceae bacterium]
MQTVGIVGLGYVGLPLAVAFAEAGDQVIGLDVSEAKVAALTAGDSYIEDIPSGRLAAVLERFTPTTDASALAAADAIVICVPTPLSAQREPDLGPLLSSARAVRGILRAGQLVVLESTTYPGTTREQLVPILEETGLVAGSDFNVAFSPERVDPGRTDFTLRNTPKVIGGLTSACLERAMAFYGSVCDVLVPVSTPEAAELEKLLENIFRSVNIALVNELAMLCDRMGIDVWEVVDAAATKPYGFMKFEPGPGMGGHCLPVDPFYLAWKAREVGFATEFIELAGKVNQHMPEYCVERVVRALNEDGRAVKGSRIALLGVSYKAGVGDMRESPALKIGRLLQALGGELVYHDPYVDEVPELGLRNSSLEDALSETALAVVVTAHPELDLVAVGAAVPSVLDLRGVTRTTDIGNAERL